MKYGTTLPPSQNRDGIFSATPIRQSEEMSGIFEDVARDLHSCLCFGPCNSTTAERFKSQYSDASCGLFRPVSSFHPQSIQDSQAVRAILSQNRLYQYRFNAMPDFFMSRRPVAFDKKSRVSCQFNAPSTGGGGSALEDLALEGFLSGTGTCQTYAILGAYYLRQKYPFELSIENIHSDLTHTYLVVHAPPDYIFDFWSGVMVRYGDWLDWNEAVNGEYAYKVGKTRFSVVARHLSTSFLNSLSHLFADEENRLLRESHLEVVHSSFPHRQSII